MSFIDQLSKKVHRGARIVLPEGDNSFIAEAAERARKENLCEMILLDGDNALTRAVDMLKNGEVDGMVAGIDHTTRDVILAVRDGVGMPEGGKTFGSLFVMDFSDRAPLILADGGVSKNPTAEQLADIAILTHDVAKNILNEIPKLALTSFSTLGSGGADPSIDKLRETLTLVRKSRSDILIDGELQLDAAINPRIGEKKAPDSPVAGHANVLILPDLNTANILYKGLEQFAGAHAYGPVLLGFNKPVSDLSRGSTVDDVYGCIAIVAVQINERDRNV
ncbi:phosphate acyltransferase [Candidatus Saccharibacteria bacterium]|nr:phosphate acyltransferase [Candidatus Saccharibacteria bacterium]